jgi:hypothetical protein
MDGIVYSDERAVPLEPLRELYAAVGWSSAKHAETLQKAQSNSHSLVTAWKDDRLIGLGNAISDGFHQHMIVADGATESMWICAGNDH